LFYRCAVCRCDFLCVLLRALRENVFRPRILCGNWRISLDHARKCGAAAVSSRRNASIRNRVVYVHYPPLWRPLVTYGGWRNFGRILNAHRHDVLADHFVHLGYLVVAKVLSDCFCEAPNDTHCNDASNVAGEPLVLCHDKSDRVGST
jgi:hypothetical protein